MNYLETWANDLISRRSLPIRASVSVEGIREAHLGPRLDFAKIQLVVDPASAFEVSIEIPEGGTVQQQFIESAVFGFLDVIMLAEGYPAKDIKVRVAGAEIDPVSSSAMAFRLAGRDAGRKYLEKLESLR